MPCLQSSQRRHVKGVERLCSLIPCWDFTEHLGFCQNSKWLFPIVPYHHPGIALCFEPRSFETWGVRGLYFWQLADQLQGRFLWTMVFPMIGDRMSLIMTNQNHVMGAHLFRVIYLSVEAHESSWQAMRSNSVALCVCAQQFGDVPKFGNRSAGRKWVASKCGWHL